MKKFVSLLLTSLMAVTLMACGSGTSSANSNSSNVTTSSTQATAATTVAATTAAAATSAETTASSETIAAATTTATEAQTTATNKVLVVYYSASGYTENVAKYIANAAGADIFEIVPSQIYSSADLDWRDSSSRVVDEYNNSDKRNVALTTTTVPNWSSYDTVFIGYPIWWGIAAWPTDTFVKANDFSGKTVIPFCTSTSSGLGESGTLLAGEAGTGNWQTGMRFASAASESEVTTWVKSLGF